MAFGDIIAGVINNLINPITATKSERTIEKSIEEKIKDKPQFARAKIDYHYYTSVGVSMIEMDAENLEKYESGLENRVSAGILRIADNKNASIYGPTFHYEKTVKNTNGVEGLLSIYPGPFTSIVLDITSEGIKKIADEISRKKLNEDPYQRIAQELAHLLPALLGELDTISRIMAQDRDSDEMEQE